MPANSDDQYLSPADAARRLGVTVKALRLYEQRGLVMPVRTAAGWRTYGPDQIARLHQALTLKRLGLPLARIAQLLGAKAVALDSVLALQESVLSGESQRVSHALELIRTARATLAAGRSLSIDDLTQLTKETTMNSKPTAEQMKTILNPFVEKHFSAGEIAETAQRPQDSFGAANAWDDLIAEAKALMAKGDPASPEALDLARRWQKQVELFTQGSAAVSQKVMNAWNDAMADPKAAPQLPLNPEIFAFVGKAAAKLKEMGK